MKNPYNRYIKECERVIRLPRVTPASINSSRNPRVRTKSEKLFRSLASFLFRLPAVYFRNKSDILKLLRAKNKKKSFSALVIGNGPSLGAISSDILDNFREHGGETFAVNYFHLNNAVSGHIPDYILLSDPGTFKGDKGKSLAEYLGNNPSINVIVPAGGAFDAELNSLGLKNQILRFVDFEFRLFRSISPCLPRGYLSMTLYKALAMALHFGYDRIAVIGMDNTYPRNIYCDESNRVLHLDIHAGMDDYVIDQSALYPSVSDCLYDIYLLFRDLDLFPSGSVVNLDKYSLTDRFEKVSVSDFFDLY